MFRRWSNRIWVDKINLWYEEMGILPDKFHEVSPQSEERLQVKKAKNMWNICSRTREYFISSNRDMLDSVEIFYHGRDMLNSVEILSWQRRVIFSSNLYHDKSSPPKRNWPYDMRTTCDLGVILGQNLSLVMRHSYCLGVVGGKGSNRPAHAQSDQGLRYSPAESLAIRYSVSGLTAIALNRLRKSRGWSKHAPFANDRMALFLWLVLVS